MSILCHVRFFEGGRKNKAKARGGRPSGALRVTAPLKKGSGAYGARIRGFWCNIQEIHQV
jgi:hypothetical protein